MGALLPWKKYKIDDFDSAVIPLAQAESHPDAVASNTRRASQRTLVEEERGQVASKPSTSSDNLDKTEAQSNDDRAALELLKAEVDADVSASNQNSAYNRKSVVVNTAIQDIGMGRYNWELFVLCGFGWFADNLWLQTVAFTLPSLSAEFGVGENTVRFTTLSLFLGLCCGALFWDVTADIMGRRPAFNLTLLGTGIFGIAAGAAPSWIGVCGIYAALGCFIGGKLPVDGALFLEFLPSANANLLTFLSTFWPVGQLCSSMIARGYLTNYADNLGWRYLNYTMGCSTLGMFACRFFLFHLFESPNLLLSKGRQQEAVMVVRAIAFANKKKTWISEEILNDIGGTPEEVTDKGISNTEILKRTVGKFSTQRIKPLSGEKKLAVNTSMVFVIWTAIGMVYPLFNVFIVQYIQKANPNEQTPDSVTYRNYAIQSIIGCLGSPIAAYTVNGKYVGHRGTMAIGFLLTGIFLFLFTISPNAAPQLAFNCMVAFFQNIGYGVLFAYSPETFPAPNRSTGSGISSGLNR